MPKNTAIGKNKPANKVIKKYSHRRTAKLFDLMFKSIIKDASSSAVVHLINGIYKKSYPLNTNVTVEPTEFIKESPKSGKMEKIISDIIVTLHHESSMDMFLMEAQINDDAEMILRIFNYSIAAAYDKKKVSADGSKMEISMPSPVVIYWENSNAKDIISVNIKFPGSKRSVVYKVPTFKVLEHTVSELEGMALLLPFYILKIRKELNKRGTDSEKRKALAIELDGIISDINKVFKDCQKNSYITDMDNAMLLRRLSRMQKELYGEHKEFREVDMKLEKLVEVDVYDAVAKAEVKAEKRGVGKGMKLGVKRGVKQGVGKGVKLGAKQVFTLLDKGMPLADVKRELGFGK